MWKARKVAVCDWQRKLIGGMSVRGYSCLLHVYSCNHRRSPDGRRRVRLRSLVGVRAVMTEEEEEQGEENEKQGIEAAEEWIPVGYQHLHSRSTVAWPFRGCRRSAADTGQQPLGRNP
ncbi:hypothetical protein ACKS0A_09080 [Histoplasma ohiense]